MSSLYDILFSSVEYAQHLVNACANPMIRLRSAYRSSEITEIPEIITPRNKVGGGGENERGGGS